MGVQDFDPRVQQAVNRIEGEGETFAVLNDARALGFRSINMDLIYGLPHQTVESFARTLDKIVAVPPGTGLSVFNYAHLPELFKTQRRIDAAALPSPAEKLAILQHTIERLTAAGVYIGMDHFAKPDDELAVAQRRGRSIATSGLLDACRLRSRRPRRHRHRHGGDVLSQNLKTLDAYHAALDAGRLPVCAASS